MKRIMTPLVVLILSASPAFSATIYVPDNYPTIQDAIDAALSGDTVIVRPGTYVELIDFKGKAITVKSEMGPDTTIIDGNEIGSVVTFKTGEGNDSILQGFTITNGDGTWNGPMTYGGGIYCVDASPTIEMNKIHDNYAEYGGGIYCTGSTCRIIGNSITDNQAGCGGYGSGGGINAFYGSPLIEENIISGNSTQSTYGGDGGGILSKPDELTTAEPVIKNNIICGNSSWGGVLGGSGGAIAVGGEIGAPTIIVMNNTLTENQSNNIGGGIAQFGGTMVISNTILWGNIATGNGKEIHVGSGFYPNSTTTIAYSDVEGGKASVYVYPGATLNWGDGMIDADPLFMDPANKDYHLSWISPCINRGLNLDAPLVDFEGDPRPTMGTTDIGADEFTGLHPLESDVFTLSEPKGGQVKFTLDAGFNNNGRTYIILGSVTGNAPGTPLPGGQVTLPINWDLFTNVVIGLINTPICQNFTGALSKSGTTYATFDTLGPLPAGTAGMTLSFGYAIHNPWDFASNPINVEIVP